MQRNAATSRVGRAPTTASAASAATGGPSGAESANVLGIMKDASSTSGELANAIPERLPGMRNAAEAIRGLPALRLDGACSAPPPVRRLLAVRPRLPPCKVGTNSGLSPPGLPDRSTAAF